MSVALSILAVILVLAVAGVVASEVRRQRDAREADTLADALRADVLKMLGERNALHHAALAAYQRGHVAGVADAARNIMADPAWRVVVSDGSTGRTVKASAPMPYAAALIIAGRTMDGVAEEGFTVEVERT